MADSFDGERQVAQQVPAVSCLNGFRGGLPDGAGVGAGPIAAHDLGTGRAAKPRGQRLGPPIWQNVDGLVVFRYRRGSFRSGGRGGRRTRPRRAHVGPGPAWPERAGAQEAAFDLLELRVSGTVELQAVHPVRPRRNAARFAGWSWPAGRARSHRGSAQRTSDAGRFGYRRKTGARSAGPAQACRQRGGRPTVDHSGCGPDGMRHRSLDTISTIVCWTAGPSSRPRAPLHAPPSHRQSQQRTRPRPISTHPP